MVALTVAPSSATLYLAQSSGITSATNTVAHSQASSLVFNLARDPFYATERRFSGSMAIAQVYNRALSATEILQNYNEQKSRFGL
jgi:hypothetical protein